MTKNVAVLASGGFDSNVLIDYLLKHHWRVTPLYVRQGFRWERAELYWLKRFLKQNRHKALAPLVVLDAPIKDVVQRHWAFSGPVPNATSADAKVYLPGRNLFLISKAALWCGVNRVHAVAIGSLDRNPFADASSSFFQMLESAIQKGLGTSFAILTPFRRWTKARVRTIASENAVRFSFSCLAPRGLTMCGRCNKCAELKKVLHA